MILYTILIEAGITLKPTLVILGDAGGITIKLLIFFVLSRKLVYLNHVREVRRSKKRNILKNQVPDVRLDINGRPKTKRVVKTCGDMTEELDRELTISNLRREYKKGVLKGQVPDIRLNTNGKLRQRKRG